MVKQQEVLSSIRRCVAFCVSFLQGCDADVRSDREKEGKTEVLVIPHTTLLPGLQFTLAGIVGKPDEFYNVPAVRFAFDLLAFT